MLLFWPAAKRQKGASVGAYDPCDPYDLSIDEVFTHEEPPQALGGDDLNGMMYSLVDAMGEEFCFLIPDDLPDWLEERMEHDSQRIDVYRRIEGRSIRTHSLVDVVSLGSDPTLEDLRKVSELWIESRNRDIG